MSGEFKKCEKGHVYESKLKECPYCKEENIDDDLKDLPPGGKMIPPMACCYAPKAWNFDEDD